MKHSSLHHVAFIMDGNRRWARENHLSLLLGHKTGAEKIEPIVEFAEKKGIRFLTFWAFSTENWNRSKKEIAVLMEVFRDALHDPMMSRLDEKNVRIRVVGDLTQFPEDIQSDVRSIIEKTSHNSGITVIIALNYGGRAELLRAVNAVVDKSKTQVTEEEFSSYLYTHDVPDPDLIIRTGGEQRLSGFLPWQSVYSELYFTKTLWPDFNEYEFDLALQDFEDRQRRFGT